MVRRGVSDTVRERLTTPNERRLAAEVLTRRVRHFSQGMIIGSRAFIDGWFELNRASKKAATGWRGNGGPKVCENLPCGGCMVSGNRGSLE